MKRRIAGKPEKISGERPIQILFPGTVFGAVLYGYDGDARTAPGMIIRGKALNPAFFLEMGPYGFLEPPCSQSVDDLNRF